MRMMRKLGLLAAFLCATGTAAADEAKELNIYNWGDYFAPDTIANFEKEFGIKVRYDTFDSNEMLDGKLSVGSTDYDVVFPSTGFFGRQIKAGVYQPLDKSKLTNWQNIDRAILDRMKPSDPKNAYAAPYLYSMDGVAYNVDMVKKFAPDAPIGSLAMVFDPAVLSKLKDCGVNFLDSPETVIRLALAYLGRDPLSQNPDDIKAAVDQLMKVRPYVRSISSGLVINSMSAGDDCISIAWSGDYASAAARAKENKAGVNLAYFIPREGSGLGIDGMLIPKDAPHPNNANIFINYILRPNVIAAITNYTRYANGVPASLSAIDSEIKNNPGLYPDDAIMHRLYPQVIRDSKMLSVITREWTRFRTGG